MTYKKPANKRRKGGRPIGYNDDIGKQICEAISRGLYKKRAAALVGIGESTLLEWISKGVNEPDKWPQLAGFVKQIEQAEALFVDSNIKHIKAAANKGDWKAAAWLAERRRPLEYGKTETRINEGDPTSQQSSFDERIKKWQAMMAKLNEDANPVND